MNNILRLLLENKIIVNIVSILFLYWIFKDIFKKRKSNKKRKVKFNRYLNSINQKYKEFSLKLYFFLRKTPILKDIIYNLRMNIIIQNAVDEEDVAAIVAQTLSFIAVSFIIAYTMSLNYFKDIILSSISALMLTIILYNKRKNNSVKFLEYLVDMIDDLVHYYNSEQGNLDNTFEKLLQTDNKLKAHFEKIIECVKEADLSKNPELIIQEYNKYTPSRYLRIICNYIYITYKYGDETINGQSMFNKNMLAIQREVNNEAEKQLEIKDETFGELVFIVSPIYFLPLAKNYLLNYFTFDGFEYIEQFLHSNYGYMVMILCAIITLICFYLYNKIINYGDILEEKEFVSWTEKILENSRKLRKIIYYISPKKESKKYYKIKDLLIKSGENEQISTFYLKKFMLGFSLLMCLVVFFTLESFTSKNTILNNIYQGINENLFEQVLLVQENPEEYKKKSIENDKKVIQYIENSKEMLGLKKQNNREEFKKQIKSYIKKENINYGAYDDLALDRIIDKTDLLLNKGKQIYILIFILLMTSIAYIIPNINLYLRSYLNKELMLYDETMGLYTTTILLINHSSTNKKVILEWLTNFSNVFHGSLRQALDNYSKDSLEQVNKDIKYKPFNRLIESLILSYEGIEIKKAFSGIEQKQLFNEKVRERNNKKIGRIKISIIRGLSWISLITTLVLYMLVPLIISALDMFQKLNLI